MKTQTIHTVSNKFKKFFTYFTKYNQSEIINSPKQNSVKNQSIDRFYARSLDRYIHKSHDLDSGDKIIRQAVSRFDKVISKYTSRAKQQLINFYSTFKNEYMKFEKDVLNGVQIAKNLRFYDLQFNCQFDPSDFKFDWGVSVQDKAGVARDFKGYLSHYMNQNMSGEIQSLKKTLNTLVYLKHKRNSLAELSS